MTTIPKNRYRKTLAALLSLFLLMFAGRLTYGYWYPGAHLPEVSVGNFFNDVSGLRKNYASEKFSKTDVQQQAAAASSQKYEKTATVRAQSSEFADDERQVRHTVKSFQAIIQFEQNAGMPGGRQLHLSIGVSPELFDSFYVAIQKIGALRSTEISKVDKTNEYRRLNAKKASLEKTLASLNELKSRGGAISDFVGLHDKILEIENQMQELGVELGNFDQENELCTVRFSLGEGATERNIGFAQRLKVALEWTIKYFAALMFGLVCTFIATYILLLVIDKFREMASGGPNKL